jgi:hypothetical protein
MTWYQIEPVVQIIVSFVSQEDYKAARLVNMVFLGETPTQFRLPLSCPRLQIDIKSVYGPVLFGELVPEDFLTLSAQALETMSLGQHEVTAGVAESLLQFTNLRSLSITVSKKVSRILTDGIPLFTKLERLSIRCCDNLVDETMMNWSRFTNLAHIDFTNCCRLTDEAAGHISVIFSLRTVNMSHTNLSDVGVALLAGLPLLHSISLNNCYKLTNIAVMHLSKARNLTDIDLSCCNHLGDTSIGWLSFAPKLQRINLMGDKKISYHVVDAMLASKPDIREILMSICHPVPAGISSKIVYRTFYSTYAEACATLE